MPFSGALATTAATRADRPLERGFTKRSGTKPDTILPSGAGNSKRMLLSFGDMPGFTSQDIHIRCPTLKGISRDLNHRRASQHKRIREVNARPHPKRAVRIESHGPGNKMRLHLGESFKDLLVVSGYSSWELRSSLATSNPATPHVSQSFLQRL